MLNQEARVRPIDTEEAAQLRRAMEAKRLALLKVMEESEAKLKLFLDAPQPDRDAASDPQETPARDALKTNSSS